MGLRPPRDNHRTGHRELSTTRIVPAIRALVASAPGVATVAGLAAMAGVGSYAHWVEPFWLDVTHTTVGLPGLPPALDGLTLAHLSDIHQSGAASPRDAAARAIATCNQTRPDVVVLTGDYVGKRVATDAFFDQLAELRVRPVYAVFGNHDYRFGPTHRRRLERGFCDLGITLLDNRAACFERAGGRLWFLGVGDGYTSHDHLDEALRDVGEADRPRVLLTHYPDLVFDLPTDRFDLALAGHSHGAQVALPFLGRQALAHSDTVFAHGLYQVNGVPLYVTRGLGTSGHRIRLLARPELPLLTLRARRSDG